MDLTLVDEPMLVISEPAFWLALAYSGHFELPRAKGIVSAWRQHGEQPLSLLFAGPAEAGSALGLTDEEQRALQEVGASAVEWQQQLSRLEDEGIGVILRSQPEYPATLTRSMDENAQPLFLFVRGDTSLFQQVSLGVVGGAADVDALAARAFDLGALLAEEGVLVHSGLSQGVGKSIVEGALSAAGGRAMVTLPMGLRGYSPHGPLAAGMAEGRLLLVSPFQPDAPFSNRRAEARYQLIAGMSPGILYFGDNGMGVAGDTALLALERGSAVYVWAHGDQDASNQEQTERVIAAGGLPLTEMADVLEMIETLIEQDISPLTAAVVDAPVEAAEQFEPIDPQATLALLSRAGRVPDSLARRLEKSQSDGSQAPQGSFP